MLKFVFELFPEDELIKPYNHPFGYIFRGVIMKWLQKDKPELIHYLHEYNQIRPYSINCHIHKKIPIIDFTLVSYYDSLSDFLIEDLLKSKKVKLLIGQKIYYISKIHFKRINIQTLIEESKSIKRFNINFVTPIYFNTILGNYSVRFPIPELFFGNLINIWNDINESKCVIEREIFINWLNAHVYISGYKLRSVRREIGKQKPVIGGLGNATYRVKKPNENFYKFYMKKLNHKFDYQFAYEDYKINCKWLEIFCKMGEYTNVGGNRTAGMGVIRYYPKNYLKEDKNEKILSTIT